ncbi:hypothetical protein KJ652_01685 [Patescibacteria group bacterium]|nr:hypothetical protein [Patescibacteria group bacterium]
MKTKVLRFGIDYLQLNLCKGFRGNTFSYLFEGFSDNSNQKYDVEFLGRKYDLSYIENRQQKQIFFSCGRYNVFRLAKNLDMGISGSVPYVFTFYGTYFYLYELEDVIIKFLKMYGEYLIVSRLDICLDVNVKVDTLWKWKRTQFRKNNVVRDGKRFESFYLGKKGNNKKYFIRVYDKKIEMKSKCKFMLTPEYLKEPVVTRIEPEIHTMTCGVLGITPQKLLKYCECRLSGDESGLHGLEEWFASLCMNNRGTYFYSLRGLSISTAKRLTTAKFTGRSKEIEKTRYVKTMLSYAKRLHESGFDVIGFLTENLPTCPI